MKTIEKFTTHLSEKGYQKRTIADQIRHVREMIKWARNNTLYYRCIKHHHLIQFIQHLQLKGNRPATINNKIASIKSFFTFLKQHNPAIGIHIKGATRKTHYTIIKEEELRPLLEKFNDHSITEKRNKLILSLIIYQALTRSEILALKTDCVSLKNGTLDVPQTAKTQARTLPLHPSQILPLKYYLENSRNTFPGSECDQLFLTSSENSTLHYPFSQIIRTIKQIHPKIGSLRQIRSARIQHWLQNQCIREVQQRIGHRFISSTQHYDHQKLHTLQEQINQLHPLNTINNEHI